MYVEHYERKPHSRELFANGPRCFLEYKDVNLKSINILVGSFMILILFLLLRNIFRARDFYLSLFLGFLKNWLLDVYHLQVLNKTCIGHNL